VWRFLGRAGRVIGSGGRPRSGSRCQFCGAEPRTIHGPLWPGVGHRANRKQAGDTNGVRRSWPGCGRVARPNHRCLWPRAALVRRPGDRRRSVRIAARSYRLIGAVGHGSIRKLRMNHLEPQQGLWGESASGTRPPRLRVGSRGSDRAEARRRDHRERGEFWTNGTESVALATACDRAQRDRDPALLGDRPHKRPSSPSPLPSSQPSSTSSLTALSTRTLAQTTSIASTARESPPASCAASTPSASMSNSGTSPPDSVSF